MAGGRNALRFRGAAREGEPRLFARADQRAEGEEERQSQSSSHREILT